MFRGVNFYEGIKIGLRMQSYNECILYDFQL